MWQGGGFRVALRRGGRGLVGVLALGAALVASATGAASPGSPGPVVPASLLAAAKASPNETFDVIVQGAPGRSSAETGAAVGGAGGGVRKTFASVIGVAATLKGGALVGLSHNPQLAAITPDAALDTAAYKNAEMWRQSADVAALWWTGCSAGPQAPAIAIVDSGVESRKDDFGERLVASVNFSSSGGRGDDQGHGTMVAGIAAGASGTYPGVARNAPIVSLRTADANGKSLTSDVISSIDWILQNKQQYNIRVANFSIVGASQVSFRVNPLDKAVERLWLSGVVVVAAAGNYGSGTGPVDMSHAPCNDPFVLCVGALDQHQTADPQDDTAPPWSAYGYTIDGFSKPDMAAPGRFMIAPVPMNSTLVGTFRDRVVSSGYMWMSGTSFAAPIVAGAAAQILARHPDWSPDQVKGALMLTTRYLPATGAATGVGEIDAAAAAAVAGPPNPNENLYAFVVTDPVTGARSFNAAAWATAVAADSSWSSANWDSANWDSANWDSSGWSAANWDSANWASDLASALSLAVAGLPTSPVD